MSNVISSLIYGRRFEYEDPRLLKLLDLMEEGLKAESGLMRQVEGVEGRPPLPAMGLLGGGLDRGPWRRALRRGLCKSTGLEGENADTDMGEADQGQTSRHPHQRPQKQQVGDFRLTFRQPRPRGRVEAPCREEADQGATPWT